MAQITLDTGKRFKDLPTTTKATWDNTMLIHDGDGLKTITCENVFQTATEAAKEYTDTATEAAKEYTDTATEAVVDRLYPVGSIYMSINPANPETFIGGTWQQLKDKFLLAAGNEYNAGDEGGEAMHTLTSNELAEHNHFYGAKTTDGNPQLAVPEWSWAFPGSYSNIISQNTTATTQLGIHTSASGGGEPHNNMPPYLAVYMWIRTA